MKKLIALTILGAFILVSPSCKKEKPLPNTNPEPSSTPANSAQLSNAIESKDGMLSFKNNSELILTVNFLSNLSHEDRLKWSENHQVRTPQSIRDEALISQSELEESLYSNVEPGLSFEELKSLGHSP